MDGAGKSTQIELVKEYYNNKGKKHKVIWGRGGWTPGLEFVKNIVRRDKKFDAKGKENYRKNIHEDPKKQKLLLIGAILDLYLYFGIYYRFCEIGKCEVICDRYIWDTYIDFKINYSRFDFEKWFIWKLLLLFIPYPKKSFMFTISHEESLRRCISKGDDFFESNEIRGKKTNLYFEMINKNKWTNVLDGGQEIEKVFNEIKELLEK
jgi:dTMP kinase